MEIMERIIKNRNCAWVNNYSDISPCIELMSVYDDVLKGDNNFINYAVKLANSIIEDLNLKNCKATWGKWGARLETDKNKKLSEGELELFATMITEHPSWLALKASTSVFSQIKGQTGINNDVKPPFLMKNKSYKSRGTCISCKKRRVVDIGGLCFDCWIKEETSKRMGIVRKR